MKCEKLSAPAGSRAAKDCRNCLHKPVLATKGKSKVLHFLPHPEASNPCLSFNDAAEARQKTPSADRMFKILGVTKSQSTSPPGKDSDSRTIGLSFQVKGPKGI
jgi:hypothetical protein